MMRIATRSRAFTIVELLVSMSILGIVLALAVVEFAMVFNHNALMSANLSADQNARIAMAKVTNELRQAMPDITDQAPGTYQIVTVPGTPPPSSAPVPSRTVSFYRVHDGPGGLVSPVPTDPANGDPVPCYDLVTLSYDPTAKTITKTVAPAKVTATCPNTSSPPAVIAYNVIGFAVTELSTSLLDVDLQTVASKGQYGVYDLNSQVALGYKP